MREKIISILAPPVFEDEEKTRIVRMLNTILLAMVVLVGILVVSRVIFGDPTDRSVIINGALLAMAVILLVVTRHGYVRAAAFVLISVGWISLIYLAWRGDGIQGIAFPAVVVIILIANLLLGWKVGVGYAVLSILAGWGLTYAQYSGLVIPEPDVDPLYESAIELSIIFGLVAVIMALTTIGLSNALQQARRSEKSLMISNRELQDIRENLEDLVRERTRALETSAEISRQLTTILNLDDLLQQVVARIQNAYGYYHVHIYLIDEDTGELIMREGTGESGRQLKAQDHKLQPGQGIVGQVASCGEAFLAKDVDAVPGFFRNPLLPKTQAELAIPVCIGDIMLGVLDVQSDEIAGLDQEDLALMQSLADQVAIAVSNAGLFEQIRKANDEIQALNERLKTENLRMTAELDVTRRLQQMLLPSDEELQQIEGVDIAGHMEPADEVGGDYYDVLQHNGQVKIGIGDVTGHGLESGVLMLMTQTAVRTLMTHNEQDPIRFMDTLNRTLHDNLQRMAVEKSLTLALLDYQTGQVRVSGQHEQVLVVRQGGRVELQDTLELGLPIGLQAGIAQFVAEVTIDLQPGDGLVLYSDGFTEAENEVQDFYGLERLCAVVSRYWSQSAEEIKQAVVVDVRHFIGQQTVYDDLTLVVIKQK